jgi:hypothetical protein
VGVFGALIQKKDQGGEDMMALFVAIVAVAVERLINKRRLKVHEVLADVGWLALIFAFIEFAYLMFVETLTVSHKDVARSLWYTEWFVFKDLFLSVATAVMLIFASLWLESAGVRIELKRPSLPRRPATRLPPPPKSSSDTSKTQNRKCDIEWHEAT